MSEQGPGGSTYTFRSRWHLAAAPARVYAVLADVEGYPSWWPQVRRARRLDAESGELTCRSLLPYDLTFVMRREVEDADALVLRARLTGDLTGTSQWTVRADARGTVAVFDEQVTVGDGRLRAAGRLLRPALRFNHDLMMRCGERGLRSHLRSSAPSGG
ncbi:MAG TPA: SRPBCC family protein [Jatrophihabitans sp.]|nr:SRPBCC family protein [Jatrophihabitans sp.]